MLDISVFAWLGLCKSLLSKSILAYQTIQKHDGTSQNEKKKSQKGDFSHNFCLFLFFIPCIVGSHKWISYKVIAKIL